MRCSPQAGVQLTPRMSRSACSRRPCLVHADEPLRRGAEHHRGVMPPAVRVAVDIILGVQQRAVGAHRLDDELAALLEFQAAHQRRVGEEPAIVAGGIGHGQVVTPADHEIILAMCRCRMHRAGSGLRRDVIAEDHRHVVVLERMRDPQLLQHAALEGCRRQFGLHGILGVESVAGEALFRQLQGEDQIAVRGVHQDVVKFSVQRHGLVGGQRPRRRRPDHDVCGRRAQRSGRRADARLEIAVVAHPEGHVDGSRGVILVLHFGFRQRRATVETPVHGLDALVEVAVGDDAARGRGSGAPRSCASMVR